MRVLKLKRLLINKNIPDLLNPAQRSNGIFSNASLDLPFAERKVLTDAISGRNLITFTRASSGTYVDSTGVIRTAVTNLLLRSEEFGTTWTTNNASVTSNSIAAPNGTITADTLVRSGTSSARIIQGATVSGVNTFTFSVYAKAGTQNFLVIQINTNSNTQASFITFDLTTGATGTSQALLGTFVLTANQPQNVGDGWLRCSLSFTGTGGADAYIGASSAANTRNGTDGGTIYLWGAQLEQSSTVGEYIPTGATINSAPRFDHNPVTGESLGLLVEEQRTNLLVQSEDFLTSWSRTGLLAFGSGSTVNAIAAPNGTITADLITEDTSSSTHRISQAGLTAVSGQNTVSVYAKQGPRSRNFMINANALTNARATFNLRTGAVENVVNGAASIQDVGSGWYRCSVTGTSTGATSSIFLQVVDGTTETYTGDGTSGIYIWGAQLEAGAFPTSYIPTTTATVTRSADVASITGTAFSSWYRQDEGTVFAEAQSLRSGGRIMMFDDGTTNNRWELRVTSSIPTLNSWSNNVQDGSASSGVNIGDPSTAFKSVGSIALNNAAISTNGATVGLDSSLALPIAINRFFIGSFQGTGTYANGTIRRLTYWPQRLPNSTLQEITR